MAAVVASLAGLLAGYGVSSGGGFVTHDRQSQEREGGRIISRPSSAALWVVSAAQAAALGSYADGLPIKGDSLEVVDAEKRSASVEVLDVSSSDVTRSSKRASRTAIKAKRVRFDLSRNTQHEVEPYSEIYGVHPKEFDFGKGGVMKMRKALKAARERDEDDEEELSLLGLRRQGSVLMGHMPRHFWYSMVIFVFLASAFGVDAFVEALPQDWQLKLA